MQPNQSSIPRRRKTKLTKIPYEQDIFNRQHYLDNPYLIDQLHKDMAHALLEIDKLNLELETLRLKNDQISRSNDESLFKMNEATKDLQRANDDKDDLAKQLKDKEDKITENQENYHNLEKSKNELEIKLRGVNQLSFLTFLASFVSGFAVTLGGNYIVGTPNVFIGCILAIIGLVIGVIAFFMSRSGQ